MSQKNEGLIGVRLTLEEVKKLDLLAQGQLKRSQVVRLVIREFLDRPEDEQKQLLLSRMFDK